MTTTTTLTSAQLLGITALGLLSACPADAPKFESPRTLGGVEVSAAVLNAGHRTYEMRCASCHGHDGAGNGPASTGLAESPRDFRVADFKYKSTPGDVLPTDDDLDITLRNGRLEGGMPAFSGLSDADRAAVIHYLKTFSPRWSAAAQEAS